MPTMFELWMWRLAPIALTSLPILAMFCSIAQSSTSDSIHTFLLTLIFACLLLHPLIRLVIAVDSVVLLRDLPDTAFLVLSWSDAIPSL